MCRCKATESKAAFLPPVCWVVIELDITCPPTPHTPQTSPRLPNTRFRMAKTVTLVGRRAGMVILGRGGSLTAGRAGVKRNNRGPETPCGWVQRSGATPALGFAATRSAGQRPLGTLESDLVSA